MDDLTYDAWIDINHHCYDVDHESVLFLFQTSLCVLRKSNTFNVISTPRWRFLESAEETQQKQSNMPHKHQERILDAVYSTFARGKDTSRVAHKPINPLEMTILVSKLLTTKIWSTYAEICSDSFPHCRRRPPLPYRRSWTTKGLNEFLPPTISFHTSLLHFLSGH